MSSSTPSRSCATSSAKPRLRLVQPYERSIGSLTVELAPTMGYRLVPWQEQLAHDIGAVDASGKWVHPRVGISIPRQQGKSVDIIVWVAVMAALAGYKVLWTEHNYSTTMEMVGRFRKIFGRRVGDTSEGIPRWRKLLVEVCSQTGQEWMRFSSGGVIQFSTRTKSSRLGFSFDIVIYDEAQELTGIHTQVINPTTTSGAKQNLMIVYAGTPTRAGNPAEVFKNLRQQAWEGGEKASDLLWLEYGVEEVGDIWDESRWPEVMPSLGYHADIRAIRTGMKDMDELGAAQEYLGYWLPPQEQVEPPVIGADAWGECLVGSGPELNAGCRICAGVRFSAYGSTVAVACAVRPPGSATVHVELPFCEDPEPSTDWLAYWIAARAGRYACVAIDGKAGAGALCDKLEGMGMPKDYILRPSTDQAVTAASLISSGAKAGSVTHIACPALDLSAETSPKRKIGSGGGWGFGGDNAAPIEAAGLALLALNTSKRKPGMKARVT